jgi:gamma-glutamylaminecyclotransferase
MAEKLLKVFVYGTLKKGQPNHHWLGNKSNGFASFLSPATTTQKMPLVIATRYNIPFLLNKPGEGSYVTGEIYEVDDNMMENLDRLESCPDLYARVVQEMNLGIGHGSMPCWIYLLNKYPEELLKLPTLTEYKNSPEQPYVEKAKRSHNFSAKDDLSYKQEATN